MEKLLEMKEICKSFGTNNVLKNVQFDLFAGEVHALIGENGAGKSTFLRILAGLEKTYSGSVIIDGEEISYKTADIISYQPDKFALSNKLSVKEVVRTYKAFFKDFDEEN